jgi:hypothetical protein
MLVLLAGSAFLRFVITVDEVRAADKIDGVLSVSDALAVSGETARIEAKLVRSGLLSEAGLGGEKLEFLVEGKVVATAMTGGDGRAFFEYRHPRKGNHTLTVTVRLVPNPRVTASAATGTLAVWERRRPILVVELAALFEEPEAPLVPLPLEIGGQGHPAPVPDAADELTRLTKFYYNPIYLAWPGKEPSGSFDSTDEIRAWLRDHKFPAGVILTVRPGQEALNAALDALKAQGWTSLKSGVGRTRGFAEVLLDHRLEVVIVPEPRRGELPRKAKTAKDWKEVRKKL